MLVIGIENEIKNLDKRTTNDANTAHVANLYAQGLVRANAQLLPEADLAESFEVRDGGKTYVFRLSPEAKFHDGHPLTSEDLDFNFREAMGAGSRAASSYADVAALETPDPRTFIIRLKRPRASFLLSDVSDLKIYPKHYAGSPEFKNAPMGSGPFRFKARRGRDLIFERNDAYRRGRLGPPESLTAFRRVVVRALQDPTTRFLSLLGGDVDLLFNALSPKRVEESVGSRYLKVYRSTGTTFQYLGLNLRLPKFQDPRVRRALALAIDRDAIIKYKLKGMARPASSILSAVNFYQNADLKPLPYDPAEAKRLLKAAGAENLEVEVKCSTDRDITSILLVIQEQWERVGIRMRLRPFEFATFFSDVQKGNFEMFSLRWTSVIEPEILNRVFHSREFPPGRNRVYYQNKTVDSLLDRAAGEMNLNTRKALYSRVQALVFQDLPYIPLWYPDNIAVGTSELKGFRLSPAGYWLSFLEAHKESEFATQ